ncbi:MAG TPA: hypothetical protein VGJ37_07165 [Pyrinomonadaceae bacterium]|jgi:Tol biopolymer transport system component
MNSQQKNRRRFSIGLSLTAILLLIPSLLAAQERIAFSTSREGNFDIWSMNSDGSDPKRLTNNPASDGDPSFSPDGSKIAFVSFRDGNSEIYVMNADGTNQKRLTSYAASDAEPAWSPDGSKIVFSSHRDNSADIFVMNADGTNPVNLTNFPDGNETEPAWSPNGRKIAFRGLRNGGIEIYVMNDDGSDQTPLTSSSGIDTEPAWSPDGTKIIFRTDRDGNSNREIYVMDADGGNQTNLTNSPGVDYAPSFSPDGSKIVFTSITADGDEIYVMDADGKNQTNLTNNTAIDSRSSWGAANSAPVLSDVTITSQVDEGGVATLTGKISDDNHGDSFTVGVEWGAIPGVTQLFELPAGARTFEFQQPYRDDKPDNTSSDTYAVKVTVDDHRFGKGTASTSITVNNVAPILANFAVTPSTVVLGNTVKLSGTVSDPGYVSDAADESLRVSLDWGDGQSEIMDLFQPGPLVVPPSHKYAAVGTYTITVKATDNDLGETVLPLTVVVSPPPPPAAPTGLRVDSIAMNRIQLVWTDASNNEDGFAIERCAQRGCNNFLEIGRVFPNQQAFLDTQLFANTQYYYRIRAFNVGGYSAYTDVVSAKTLRK